MNMYAALQLLAQALRYGQPGNSTESSSRDARIQRRIAQHSLQSPLQQHRTAQTHKRDDMTSRPRHQTESLHALGIKRPEGAHWIDHGLSQCQGPDPAEPLP